MTAPTELERWGYGPDNYPGRPKDGTLLVDDETAICTLVAFKTLCEYSASLPTGQYVGKRWKAMRQEVVDGQVVWVKWWLCEFVEDPTPGYIGIKYRELLVLDG